MRLNIDRLWNRNTNRVYPFFLALSLSLSLWFLSASPRTFLSSPNKETTKGKHFVSSPSETSCSVQDILQCQQEQPLQSRQSYFQSLVQNIETFPLHCHGYCNDSWGRVQQLYITPLTPPPQPPLSHLLWSTKPLLHLAVLLWFLGTW